MDGNGWGGIREGAGRKPGYESTLRATGYQTRVARVPKHWNVVDIEGGLEHMASIIGQYEAEIAEAASKSRTGKVSNRYWKLQEAIEQMKASFPRSYFEAGRWNVRKECVK